MSTTIESIRYLWKKQLDEPFNAVELRRIKEDYDRQMKMDKIHRDLWDFHRAEHYRDRMAAKQQIEQQMVGKTKQEVATACGFAGYSASSLKRLTIKDMIDSYVFSKVSDMIKSEYDRVKEHWERLTDAQKVGDEPIDYQVK